MGSFTKKYIRAYHPEDWLHLSWDIGYKNVALYDGKRLVKQFDLPGPFTRGVTFHDEKLGKIHLAFTQTKPLMLEMKVNGKKYKPTKKGKQEVDLSGAIAVFWSLLVGTGILLIISSLFYWSTIPILFGLNILVILGIIMAIYLSSIILLSRKKYWGFYLGFSYLMVSTAYFTFNASVAGFTLISGLYIIIRMILLAYLIINIRNVTYAIRNFGERKDDSLLDDPV
jgi:hypothetical protein